MVSSSRSKKQREDCSKVPKPIEEARNQDDNDTEVSELGAELGYG
jgi:hypothetical protein